uniref:Flagella basal body P-ring formation protein FlgA n=1 Tax=Magnetococcus massalia (strain MO-1) TaxID=451514 RepID=A0A1S7LE68_MAGMO|nr:putative flagella basal body P-ring formation protein FlgA [Candidatus Magnetococcus massalia]
MMAFMVLLIGLMGWQAAWGQTFSRTEMAKRVGEQLRQVLQENHPSLAAGSVFVRHTLNLPDGSVNLVLDATEVDDRPGRQNIPVTVVLNGSPYAVVDATVMFRKKLLVATLNRSVKKGEMISGTDLSWQEKQVTRGGYDFVRDFRQVVGKAAQRPLRANIPLRAQWFNDPLAIERGERVRVIVKSGGLTIRTIGVAVKDGRVGDAITIRNPESHRRYLATVIAPGQVKVEGL